MTARRRRRSGSGPSATAVIAWVGGARTIAEHTANRAFSGQSSVAALVADRPRALSGHVRGVAMGSALAAASVLGMTVHAGDGAPGSADATGALPGPAQQPPAAAPALAAPQPVTTAFAADQQEAPAPTPSAAAAAGLPLGAGPAAGVSRAGHGAGEPGTAESPGAAAPERAQSESAGAGQSQQQSGGSQGEDESEPGPLRSALAPVASAPRQAVDAARQTVAPLTSRVSAPTTRSGGTDGAAAQRLSSPVDRAAAMLAETGQPALAMLSGPGLGQ